MDIFNLKRVEELEEKLHKAERDRDKYMSDLATLKLKFDEMGKLEESTPNDCIKGPWCKACEFVREFHHVEYYGMGNYNITPAYVCSKGVSCNNFVQREVAE
jgi:hypothetical protein